MVIEPFENVLSPHTDLNLYTEFIRVFLRKAKKEKNLRRQWFGIVFCHVSVQIFVNVNFLFPIFSSVCDSCTQFRWSGKAGGGCCRIFERVCYGFYTYDGDWKDKNFDWLFFFSLFCMEEVLETGRFYPWILILSFIKLKLTYGYFIDLHKLFLGYCDLLDNSDFIRCFILSVMYIYQIYAIKFTTLVLITMFHESYPIYCRGIGSKNGERERERNH